MQGVIEQIRLYYPEVASLLNPPVRDENLLDMAQSLDLPDDYYRLYALADGEAEERDRGHATRPEQHEPAQLAHQ